MLTKGRKTVFLTMMAMLSVLAGCGKIIAGKGEAPENVYRKKGKRKCTNRLTAI